MFGIPNDIFAKSATDVELALWRSGLISDKANVRDVVTAARRINKAGRKIQRSKESECNGVPKEWDSNRREWIMGLDGDDQERLANDIAQSENDIYESLRPILKRGYKVKFYGDPRGATFRVSDAGNTKDAVFSFPGHP